MFTQKKTLIGFLSLLLLVWIGETFGYSELHFGIQKVLAVPAAPSTSSLTELTQTLGIGISAITTLIFLIYPLNAVLLSPNFFLDIHSSSTVIITIWRTSRDIMNVIFAFMLLAGACMTVVTAKEDYIKNNFLKFILGIILVNFSWFFPRVILDMGNVLTATIYQLPTHVGTQCRTIDEGGNTVECEFPHGFKYFDEAVKIKSEGTPATPPNTGIDYGGYTYKCPTTQVCFQVTPLIANTNTASGIMGGLIYNHGKLKEIPKVPNLTGGANNDPMKQMGALLTFVINTIFRVGLGLAIFLAMLALMVAFIIRIPILWMTMAFMPFMFIGFVMGDKMGNFNTMKIFQSFVKAAFLPAVTAIPFAVGFIVINAVLFSPVPSSAEFLSESVGKFLPGVTNLWLVLWHITTILIIWKGVFMALAIDDVYTGATKGIQGIGGSLGKVIAKAPLSATVIPFGKRGKDGKVPKTSLGKIARIPGQMAMAADMGALDKAKLKEILGGKRAKIKMTDSMKTTSTNLGDSTNLKAAIASNNPEAVVKEMRLLNAKFGNNDAAHRIRIVEHKLGKEMTEGMRESVLSKLTAGGMEPKKP